MKELFKGTIPTIALLLVAIMSLSSLTYAWFIAGDTVMVETVDVDVKSVDGLLISSNGFNGTWGSNMNPEIAEYDTLLHKSSSKLQDVSCAGDIDPDTGALIFYNVEYDNLYDALLTAVRAPLFDTNSECANWISFDMYLRNDGAAPRVVSLEGSTVTGRSLSKAASRIALVDAGTAVASMELEENTAPAVTGEKTLLGIWEPNADQHTGDGTAWLTKNGMDPTAPVADYKAVGAEFDKEPETYVNVATGDTYALVEDDLTLTDVTKATYSSTDVPRPAGGQYYIYSFAAAARFEPITIDSFFDTVSLREATDSQTGKSKAGVYTKNNGTYTLVPTGTTIESSETYYMFAYVGGLGSEVKAYTRTVDEAGAILRPMTTMDASGFTFTIPANTIQKVTVYIWVEGQDADCTNYVSGYPFRVDLTIKTI